MEQHPIPQQISSYQFRLVGDMTLKQFLQLAAGALVSLLFYSLPLHPIIKWPFILFFFALGAALAFLPFKERPLEKWILAFFRSVYSPTIYTWRPALAITNYYQPETTQNQTNETGQSLQTSTANSNKLPFLASLEEKENVFLSKLSTMFSSTNPNTPISPNPTQLKASPNTILSVQTASQPNYSLVQNANNLTSSTPVEIPVNTRNLDIKVPEVTPISVTPQQQSHPRMVVQELGINSDQNSNTSGQTIINPQVGQFFVSQSVNGQAAQFSTDAAPPNPPENPNLVVGQVMDSNGKIVEGAILEVQDEQGRPVRALKSNKAGHFMIVTPLLNGHYTLTPEKDGLEFNSITFEALGQIIPPIAVRAKNSLSEITNQPLN